MRILNPQTGETVEITAPALNRRLEERAARKAARLAEKAQARSRIAGIIAQPPAST